MIKNNSGKSRTIVLALFFLSIQLLSTGIFARADSIENWTATSTLKPHYYATADSDFKIHQLRPRLYLRPADIDIFVTRASGSLSEQWDYLNYMASYFSKLDPSGSEVTKYSIWYGKLARAVALIALLENNQAYTEWSIKWAGNIATLTNPSSDSEHCYRIERMSLVYDWLHHQMSATERGVIRDGLVTHVNALMSNYSHMQNPSFTGGHTRDCHSALAMALIALQGDYTFANDLLGTLRNRLLNGFYPTQSWISTDGGYHMGWGYTRAYNDPIAPYLIWSVGTTDSLLDDWQSKISQWYLFGMRGDDTFPETGDAFNLSLGMGARSTIYAAGVEKDPYAKWFVDKLGPKKDSFLQLLLLDPNIESKSPESLPKDKLFRNAGTMISRDGWDGDSTQFIFKSTSFITRNHHHLDQNSFAIFFREPLAIDSGYYDTYGTPHWKNYFTRTIAHNAITVYDPNQIFLTGNQKVSNDGGQLANLDPRTLAEIGPGGKYHLSGITQYEQTDKFSYAIGNATKAYDPDRVTQAEREVFFLRDTGRAHPIVLVFDRVKSTNAYFKKSFLLHTINKPNLRGMMATASEGQGRITSKTLYPANALLNLVGGPGQEFLVDGTNYPHGGSPADRGINPGAWRLEVNPATPKLQDYFLHALFIDDSTAAIVPESAAQLVENQDWIGARIGQDYYFFPRVPKLAQGNSHTATESGTYGYLFTGFQSNQPFTVRVNGTTKIISNAGNGGLAKFHLTVNTGDIIEISSSGDGNSADSPLTGVKPTEPSPPSSPSDFTAMPGEY